jgi:hypothetical protein
MTSPTLVHHHRREGSDERVGIFLNTLPERPRCRTLDSQDRNPSSGTMTPRGIHNSL